MHVCWNFTCNCICPNFLITHSTASPELALQGSWRTRVVGRIQDWLNKWIRWFSRGLSTPKQWLFNLRVDEECEEGKRTKRVGDNLWHWIHTLPEGIWPVLYWILCSLSPALPVPCPLARLAPCLIWAWYCQRSAYLGNGTHKSAVLQAWFCCWEGKGPGRFLGFLGSGD